MLVQRQPFDRPYIDCTPEEPGIYIIYDLAGPIYVGRSGCNIRRRLQTHHSGSGNRNVAMAMRIGAGSSLTFRYCLLSKSEASLVEGVLIQELGAAEYANLRREQIPDDPEGWESGVMIAKSAMRLPR